MPRMTPRHRPPWWPAGEPWPPPPWFRHHWRRGGPARRLFFVIPIVGFFVLVAVVSLALRALGAAFGLTAEETLPVFVISAGLIFAFGISAMRRFVAPLADIVEAADRVARGDFSARLERRGAQPIRVVAGAFNSMAETLAAQEQQRRHLLAEIAHELRTPLSVLQGKVEGVLDGVYPRDDATLNGVVEDIRHLARLVEDLRLLSIAESGALTLQKEPTDLGLLAHDVVASFAAEADSRGLALRAEMAPDLPAAIVDPVRIRQVLSNLLANALRHTTSGSVRLTGDREPAAVVLRVIDTGPGIEETELPRIFDRFYRGGNSKGSGLGLTIARDLVAAHGGTIAAASQPGRGTTITIRLPMPA